MKLPDSRNRQIDTNVPFPFIIYTNLRLKYIKTAPIKYIHHQMP